jgi:hypothetical protein
MEHLAFAKEKLGEARFDALTGKKNNLELGKIYKRTKGKGSLSIHFKREFERMQEEVSRDFSGWIN